MEAWCLANSRVLSLSSVNKLWLWSLKCNQSQGFETFTYTSLLSDLGGRHQLVSQQGLPCPKPRPRGHCWSLLTLDTHSLTHRATAMAAGSQWLSGLSFSGARTILHPLLPTEQWERQVSALDCKEVKLTTEGPTMWLFQNLLGENRTRWPLSPLTL